MPKKRRQKQKQRQKQRINIRIKNVLSAAGGAGAAAPPVIRDYTRPVWVGETPLGPQGPRGGPPKPPGPKVPGLQEELPPVETNLFVPIDKSSPAAPIKLPKQSRIIDGGFIPMVREKPSAIPLQLMPLLREATTQPRGEPVLLPLNVSYQPRVAQNVLPSGVVSRQTAESQFEPKPTQKPPALSIPQPRPENLTMGGVQTRSLVPFNPIPQDKPSKPVTIQGGPSTSLLRRDLPMLAADVWPPPPQIEYPPFEYLAPAQQIIERPGQPLAQLLAPANQPSAPRRPDKPTKSSEEGRGPARMGGAYMYDPSLIRMAKPKEERIRKAEEIDPQQLRGQPPSLRPPRQRISLADEPDFGGEESKVEGALQESKEPEGWGVPGGARWVAPPTRASLRETRGIGPSILTYEAPGKQKAD